MSLAERVVAVFVGREPDPSLGDIFKGEGYDVVYAESCEDLRSAAEARLDTPCAIVLRFDNSSEIEAYLREAAGQLPSAKFLFIGPEDGDCPGERVSEGGGAAQRLCISGDVHSRENIRRIGRFLEGDGHQWASDLEPGQTDGAFLLDSGGDFGDGDEKTIRQLRTFVKHLSGFTDLGEMLREALHKCMELLRCEAGSIYMWDEMLEVLILEVAEGPEQDKRLGLRQKLGEGLAGWVAEVGEPILVTDTRKVARLRKRACSRYSDFSCLATPVKHGDQLLGVVCLAVPRDNKPFEPGDLHLAGGLSAKLGPLVRPLRLVAELRSYNERLLRLGKSYSDLVAEKDTQVDAMRALSVNILSSIPIGAIAYDTDLRVRFANAAARALNGASAQGAAARSGLPLEDGLNVDRETWLKKLRNVMEKAGEFRLNRVMHRSDDKVRVLNIHCSSLDDSDGNVKGGILMIQDVTEDVELEAKLSGAERLALVGKIAAKVAHELNNPLDGILRFLNLAIRQMRQSPEQAQSYLEESRRGLLLMRNIVTGLLTFSRGHHKPGRPVSLSQIVRNAVALYEERARATNIEIRMEVPLNLPSFIRTDLGEVCGNVVKNAIDAMPKSGVLTVRAAQNGNHVKITISDTGPGVPEELREKVFEPFFSTKQSDGGTGLGLAACRDSLKAMGGEIKLCPSDVGAVFEITVPVSEQRE